MDFADAWKDWGPIFKNVVATELSKRIQGKVKIEEPVISKASGPAPKVLEDIEEEESDEAEPPPRPTPKQSLKDRLKSKRAKLKKKKRK